MKNPYILSIAGILVVSIAIGCKHPSGTSQDMLVPEDSLPQQQEVSVTKDTIENEVLESGSIAGQFKMFALSTAGVIFSVEDQYGNDFDFWDRNPQSVGLEVLNPYPPNEYLDELQYDWFRIGYEKRMLSFYNGAYGTYDKREGYVITTVEKLTDLHMSENAANVNIKQLMNMKCVGTEPFWRINLYPDYAELSTPEIVSEKLYYLNADKSLQGFVSIDDATIIDNNVAHISCISGVGRKVTLSIRKQKCSDDMSEKVYTHKVQFQENGNVGWPGCGELRND